MWTGTNWDSQVSALPSGSSLSFPPCEFFPLTQITTRSPPLSSSRQQSTFQHFCTSFHWEYWASPWPASAQAPCLSPRASPTHSSTAFAMLKVQPGGFSLLKAP